MGLSRVHFPVTTLGPGKRLAIWFQGCHIRCKGCISKDTWPKAQKQIEIDDLLEQIDEWILAADGITISGGEPFEQPEALAYLLQCLKQRTAVDILVYSGFPFTQIAPQVALMRYHIDVIITEPFQYDTPQTLTLRGSDNQVMHLLTPLGQHRFYELQQQSVSDNAKVLDIMFDDEIWLAGIPKRDDFLTLQNLLQQQGHQLTTTAHQPNINNANEINRAESKSSNTIKQGSVKPCQ